MPPQSGKVAYLQRTHNCVTKCIVDDLCWSRVRGQQAAKQISYGGLESWHEIMFEGAPTIKICIVNFLMCQKPHLDGFGSNLTSRV